MGYQVVKLIVHFVHLIHDYGRKDLLDSYVKVWIAFLDYSLQIFVSSYAALCK
jgi:hypothetical protein